MSARIRRQYHRHLTCQDCGRSPAARIVFWVNAFPYRVCGRCIRAYLDRILKPSKAQNDGTFPPARETGRP